MCLASLGTISFHEGRLQISEAGRKQKSQFEIAFKSVARFSTQFRAKESFKKSFWFKDGIISFLGWQKLERLQL